MRAERTGGALAARLASRLMRLPPAVTRDVRVTRGIRVPMRDGVDLLADHYAPAGGGRPPTLLVRNLYGWDLPVGLLYGRLYAERGYQVLVQRCRGTFGSGGTLDPWLQEAADGRDTAAWMSEQDWFSGEFATIGASYLGYVQWALLDDPPPGLRGSVVQMGPHEYARVAWPGGAFALDTMAGWASMLSRPKRGPVRDTVRQLREERRLQRIAYRELPLGPAIARALGRDYPHLDAWLAHEAEDDPYWSAADRSAGLVRGPGVPVLLQGNWYDAFLPQTLQQYALLRAGGAAPRLTIGPWTHTAVGRWWPVFMADSLDWLAGVFPEHQAVTGHGVRPGRDVRPGYGLLRPGHGVRPDRELVPDRGPVSGSDHGAAGRPAGRPAEPDPVRLFLLGAEEWRGFAAWPPPQAVSRSWYLHPGGRLDPAPPPPSGPDRYRYEPADPTPAVGGAWTGAGAGPRDNRALEARPDVLTFTTDPLEADLDVLGEVSAELYVRSGLAHTDFFARLCDVHPDGRSVDITDGLIRVRPGSSAAGRIDADGVLALALDLAPTACRFRTGHRLRLQVSSGAHPRFARNPGSGEPTASAVRLLAADQEIHHDPRRPSAIRLSVLPPGS
ncbi:hydrolase [Streptomyces hygroscopicus subsp. hygroscopicus]|nr:CocE/NonD family hydrolase [Streptomyces hygroscopicus]GLX49050.1 hydrolase [Streptomyces hygroscopicus subsp. hygroscopicus]